MISLGVNVCLWSMTCIFFIKGFIWHLTLCFIWHLTLCFIWHLTLCFIWHLTLCFIWHLTLFYLASNSFVLLWFYNLFSPRQKQSHQIYQELEHRWVGQLHPRATADWLPPSVTVTTHTITHTWVGYGSWKDELATCSKLQRKRNKLIGYDIIVYLSNISKRNIL